MDFEFRQDEYHRHWATSIGETFAFHMRAFDRSDLDNVPVVFDHANAYRKFDVWGYHVESEGDAPGLTYLDQVRQEGLRVTTRQWAPDGPPVERAIEITTAPLYKAGASYRLIDYNLTTGKTNESAATADAGGRLRFRVDGTGHQISFAGPGTGAEPPVLLPVTSKDMPRVPPNEDVSLPIRVYNPRGEAMKDVRVEISSDYPTVKVVRGSTAIPEIAPGQAVDVSSQLQVRFTAGRGYFEPTRLDVHLTFDGWHEADEAVEVLVIPEAVPAPLAVEVLDGRTMKFAVFKQAGNQGGGAPVEREVTEGSGNGNGVLEPGEEATVWVKMAQGMDPFDKNTWYRCKVYSDSPYLSEVGDLRETKQTEWTGSQSRTSLIRLSPETPAGTSVELLLDNESLSFYFTPDVRYGREKLYQAFQRHRRHLHRLVLQVGK